MTERRKLKTIEEFRIKAVSLRQMAAKIAGAAARNRMLAMADAWEAKAALAETGSSYSNDALTGSGRTDDRA